MSEQAKTARRAMKEKISRLVRTDPKQKVDASDYTPPDALDADVKTGLRPISRRQFKKGGKVVAVHGEQAKAHAGRTPRKSGGKALTANSLVNRDVREANEGRDGSKHVGGFKKGGRTKKASGGDIAQFLSPAYALMKNKGLRQAVSPAAAAGGLKRGGKAEKHDDTAEDTKLIKKLVKPSSIKGHAPECRCAKCGGGRAGRATGGVNWSENEGKVNVPPELHSPVGEDKSARLPPVPPKKPASPPMPPKKKRGGSLSVSDGELEGTRPTGGRLARKSGGRAKGKTNINIIIGTGQKAPAAPAGVLPPMGPDGGPPGLRQGTGPGAGMPPPGAAPMPAGGPPPMAGPGGPPPMMPPMGRKTGGRVKYPIDHASGGGLGRLEKIKAYGDKAGPVVNGKSK